MFIPVKTTSGEYDIVLERGALGRLDSLLELERKVLVVTDSGVPSKYAELVAKQCKNAVVITIEQGEASKNIDTFTSLLAALTKNHFDRSDCVVAVGGGVVGDLSGFVASVYMRGIDFYNIPTTVLSQVDSSIGGKTAIDFMGYKNIVGAFYQPKRVVIDPETLSTLPARQISNGLSEALKMALTSDTELFDIFEKGNALNEIDTVIHRSLLIKKAVVEQDEKESGLRRILNFGHTLAHAIESVCELQGYYHGECVAIGMLPMCSSQVKERLIPILEGLSLPTHCSADVDALIEACRHDKKLSGSDITVVEVAQVGTFELKKITFDEFEQMVRRAGM